jgi:cytochrome c oxidase subunit II
MMRRAALPLMALLALAGCGGWQSALETRGPQSEDIRDLFILFLVVCGLVWGLVALALAHGLWRRRQAVAGPASPLETNPATDRRAERIITVAIAASAVILVVLTGLSYLTGKGLAAMQGREDALTIKLTGHQWWWEIRYEDPQPHRVLTTANEIHIPVGRPIRILLASTDVIHSFWVPNLHGKRDLIPGQENEIWLRADRPGVFRGQCAEFCGAQHGHMGLLVLARPPEEFEAWREAQLAPAAPPQDPERQRGLEIFQTGPCMMCHAIRGTSAAGRVAPELTHLASRRTLAAGTLPMTRGALAAWIADPQSVKPGNHMPLMQFPAQDFQALVSYLEGLR